jgi:hypothetical protein
MGHDGAALVLLAQLVGTDPNKEIHLSKREFGLPKLESVPGVVMAIGYGPIQRQCQEKLKGLPKVEKIVDTLEGSERYKERIDKEISRPSAYIRTGRLVGGLLIWYGRWGSPSTAFRTNARMSASVKEAGLKVFAAAGTGTGSSGTMIGIMEPFVVEVVAVVVVVGVPFRTVEVGTMVAEGGRQGEGEVRVEVESKLRWCKWPLSL